MRAAPTMPTPPPLLGRTFLVAISLLGAFACVQIGVISWQLFQTAIELKPAVSASVSAPAVAKPATPASAPIAKAGPAAMNPTAAPAPTAASAPAPAVSVEEGATPKLEQTVAEEEQRLLERLPKPTPLPVHREATPESRVSDLVAMARALRDRGDTSTALTRLREAQTIAPRNVEVISEMATTYEKMGITDKAISQWRRIYELGEQAGIYYAAAEAKLRALQLPDVSAPPPVPASTPLPETGALDALGTPATLQPPKEASSSAPALTLGKVGTVDDTGNSLPLRKLKLRVPILARPGLRVDVHDVTIQVFFYDQLENQRIVETNADVRSEWSSAPVDWASADPELLDVEYAQSEPAPKKRTERERRNYFGYVVRVYYKGELNATYAEPIRLLKQFPPPLTLQNSDLPQ